MNRMLSREHNLNGNYSTNSPAPAGSLRSGKRFATNENNTVQSNQMSSTPTATATGRYNNQFAGSSFRQSREMLGTGTNNTSDRPTSSLNQIPHTNSVYGQSTSATTTSTSCQRQDQSMTIPHNKPYQSQYANSVYGQSTSATTTSTTLYQRQDQSTVIPQSKPYQSQYQNGNTSKNTLGIMGMPKPPTTYSKTASTASSSSNSSKVSNVSQDVDGRLKMKKSGESEAERLCVLTGTVERVIKYGKIFQNHFCYFQVIGSVVSIADGKVQFEKTMLLRDKKGPILQLTYYSNSTHIHIEDFHLGQNLRAVGRMIGPNVMSAITIRAATNEELDILPRMCYISDYAVSSLCGDSQMPTKP